MGSPYSDRRDDDDDDDGKTTYLGESLADVKQRWSGNRVSEVGGREQEGRHLQIDQLEKQKYVRCVGRGAQHNQSNHSDIMCRLALSSS